jgi:phosphoribosyl-AMP cyclohydrolase
MEKLNDLPWLEAVAWNEQGLVPAISQDAITKDILMVAWMNREALAETIATSRGVYWSRSRGKLWRKGEESGHIQHVKEVRLDCDQDVILLMIDQVGAACHTGRRSCFFSQLVDGQWQIVDKAIVDPESVYK